MWCLDTRKFYVVQALGFVLTRVSQRRSLLDKLTRTCSELQTQHPSYRFRVVVTLELLNGG